MESLEASLAAHPFLADLEATSFAFMASCATPACFEPGEFLLREGEPADRFFLIRSGRVALEIHAGSRGTIQVESVGAGEILGLSWLLAPARWHLDGRAVEPVTVFAFDAPCLKQKMDTDHDIGYALTQRILAQTIRRLERVRLQRLDLFQAEAGR